MLAIMADHDIEGQVRLLLRILTSGEWGDFWKELDCKVESFESLGIPYSTPDRELWRIRQARQIVLITGNRNKADSASLHVFARSNKGQEGFTFIAGKAILHGVHQ